MKAGLLAAPLLISSTMALAQGPDTPEKAVAQCVSVVRSTKLEQGELQFVVSAYRKFDAYYNLNTKKVYYKSNTAADGQAQFVFGKCMNELGFPVGD
jgi:hypothetical protein